MTLSELIGKLQEIEEDLAASGVMTSQVEVLAGTSPSHPIAAAIVGVISGEELEDHCEERLTDPERLAVWVATEPVRNDSPYMSHAPRPLWDAIATVPR